MESVKFPGLKISLQRNEVTKGERILGVRLALDGNDDDEFVFRLNQSKELAGRISGAPFSRLDAEVIYCERWVPSIGYCLPITQFSTEQCQAIQIPFFQAILPRMGFNRHIPKAIRFGPLKYNGKGLADLETHQLAQHLDRLVGYIRRGEEVGDILQLQIETHQLLIGSSQLFFNLDPKVYSYGEKSRPQYLWEQCY